MQDKPKISEAEWTVMKVFWEKSPLKANEVVGILRQSTPWKPKTIKTLINRLAAKKVLGFEKAGREYCYYPLYSEAECIGIETSSFLARAGAGALKPMLAAFVAEQKLSADEIEELKKILEGK